MFDSESAIIDYVGETYAERGRVYYEEGRLQAPRIEEGRLHGECWGSRSTPYDVEVAFGEEGIVHSWCTCPVREPCKHVAALLYHYLEQPGAVAHLDRVRARLDELSHGELVEVVMEIADRSSEVERFLERELLQRRSEGASSEEQPDEIRGLAERAFRAAFERASGHGFGDVVEEVVDDLERLAAVGTRHRDAGRPERALEVWAPLIEVVLEHDFEGGRELDPLFTFLEGLQAELVGLLERVDRKTVRERILDLLWRTFELDLRHEGVGLAEPFWRAVESAFHDEERAECVARAERRCREQRSAGWPHRRSGRLLLRFVDTFGGEAPDLEQRVEDYEELEAVGDLVDTLLDRGLSERARVRARSVEYTRDFVTTLERFVEHGRTEIAEELARERLGAGNQEYALRRWLVDRFVSEERGPEALEVALEMLETHPSREVYDRIELLARGLGCWEEVRDRARATLRERAPRAQLEVLIEENQLDEAVELWREVYGDTAREPWRASDVELELAERIERSHPETAVEIWRREADMLVASGGTGEERRIAELLGRVRDRLREVGREERWQEIRADILQGSRNEAKLAAALEAADSEPA